MKESEANEVGPSHDEIRRQVELICANRPLDIARSARRLLHHIVEATLRQSPTSEKGIAIALYGVKSEDFDSDVHTTGRVATTALRSSLRDFYETDVGKQSPIEIDIKKYVAIISFRNRCLPVQAPSHGAVRGSVEEESKLQVSPEGVFVVQIDKDGFFQFPRAAALQYLPGSIVYWCARAESEEIHLPGAASVLLVKVRTHYFKSVADYSHLPMSTFLSLAFLRFRQWHHIQGHVKVDSKLLADARIPVNSQAYLWKGEGLNFLLATKERWEQYTRLKASLGQ